MRACGELVTIVSICCVKSLFDRQTRARIQRMAVVTAQPANVLRTVDGYNRFRHRNLLRRELRYTNRKYTVDTLLHGGVYRFDYAVD